MTEAPVRVRMEHVRAVRGCSRGARAFCARHGLDWARFLREGLPAEVLEATGDAMAIKLCEEARRGR